METHNDGLEMVTPFKCGHFWYVKFSGGMHLANPSSGVFPTNSRSFSHKQGVSHVFLGGQDFVCLKKKRI